ncbi:MAG: hypothetical protein OSB47_07675, partial [Pirellulaceae bacterium]|nr:hypothetical protein [Pirellulaceae bacterium]
MKNRTPIISQLTKTFCSIKKRNPAKHIGQSTSFTPQIENLENRALLTTLTGLTLEPATDDVLQVSNHAGNTTQVVLEDLNVTQRLDKSSTRLVEQLQDQTAIPDVTINTPDTSQSATDEDHKDWFSTFDDIMSGTDNGDLEQIANSQKNDAAYIKFDGIMAGPDTDALEGIANSQKNDAAYIKFDGIMSA